MGLIGSIWLATIGAPNSVSRASIFSIGSVSCMSSGSPPSAPTNASAVPSSGSVPTDVDSNDGQLPVHQFAHTGRLTLGGYQLALLLHWMPPARFQGVLRQSPLAAFSTDTSSRPKCLCAAVVVLVCDLITCIALSRSPTLCSNTVPISIRNAEALGSSCNSTSFCAAST